MSDLGKILIVDDDASIRTVFSTQLIKAGYAVEPAENGKQAIEKSKAGFYNLALIDIRLPDMEGIDLLTALKQTTPKMRKIIVTGFPNLQNAIKAVNNDADAYLTKPVDIKVLLAKIKEQLNKQQEDDEYTQNKIADYIMTKVS
jgi:DNA-binding NtrC family response regulator